MDSQRTELTHYGVLGMKWGVRKADKYQKKASTTKNSKKAEKYQSKANALTEKHTKRAGSSNVTNYTKNESWGKSIVKSIVFGTYGALNYNRARSVGTSRTASAIGAFVSRLGNATTGGLLSIIEPRVDKQDELSRVKNEGSKLRDEVSKLRDKING